ncbi:MAG: hypothetical protein OXD46_14545 [Chloroflexi bacterium]|nr:hypothetical protein [Chloroflexota bacterium]
MPPGYSRDLIRVVQCVSRDGNDLVILWAGGTKKRQAGDIALAQTLWRDYKQEKRDADTRI